MISKPFSEAFLKTLHETFLKTFHEALSEVLPDTLHEAFLKPLSQTLKETFYKIFFETCTKHFSRHFLKQSPVQSPFFVPSSSIAVFLEVICLYQVGFICSYVYCYYHFVFGIYNLRHLLLSFCIPNLLFMLFNKVINIFSII